MMHGPIMSYTILLDDVWSDNVWYNIFLIHGQTKSEGILSERWPLTL